MSSELSRVVSDLWSGVLNEYWFGFNNSHSSVLCFDHQLSGIDSSNLCCPDRVAGSSKMSTGPASPATGSMAKLLQKRLQSSQSERRSIEEAEGMRSESGSDSDSLPHPEEQALPWWVGVLKGTVDDSQLQVFESKPKLPLVQSAPLKVLSGCTGCCAEAFALKVRLVQIPAENKMLLIY